MTKTFRSLKIACIVMALALTFSLVACYPGTMPLERGSDRNQAPNDGTFIEIITVDATCLLDGFTIEKHWLDGEIVWIGNQQIVEIARGHHCLVQHPEEAHLLICVHCGWITGVLPQVPGENSVYGCDCDEVSPNDDLQIRLGFIGWYIHESRPDSPMQTSFYWQTLNAGDMIDWVAVDAAYEGWIAIGGLAPLREQWQTSGFASFTFADYAKIGHADFTTGQLESHYLSFFVCPGYVSISNDTEEELPAHNVVIAPVKKDLVITGISLLPQSNGQRWYRVTINGSRVLNYNNETSSSSNRLTISDKGLQTGTYVVEIFGQNAQQTLIFELVYTNKTVVSVNVLSYTTN
jgi:hypothetical protein